MSQVNTTDPAAGPASGTAQPGGVPGGSPGGDDGFIRVPRDALGDYRDWHSVMRDAKAYRGIGDFSEIVQQAREAGWTPDAVVEALNNYAQAAAAGAGSTVPSPAMPPMTPGADPGYGAPSSLTPETIEQVVSRVVSRAMENVTGQLKSTLDERERQAREEAERIARRERARQAEQDFAHKTLSEYGVKLFEEGAGEEDEPKMTRFGRLAYLGFQNALNEVLLEKMPDGLSEDQITEYLANPTNEHLQEAARRLEWLKELKLEHAAQVAKEQEQVPGETLGGGPSGGEPPKNFEDMTEEEKMEAVMSRVPLPE